MTKQKIQVKQKHQQNGKSCLTVPHRFIKQCRTIFHGKLKSPWLSGLEHQFLSPTRQWPRFES